MLAGPPAKIASFQEYSSHQCRLPGPPTKDFLFSTISILSMSTYTLLQCKTSIQVYEGTNSSPIIVVLHKLVVSQGKSLLSAFIVVIL